MAIWYRAHKRSQIPYVFSGDGGLYAAGRWSRKGQRAVYCSDSVALATLEWLSHNGLSVSAFSYHTFSIEIPDALVTRFLPAQIPRGWDATPASDISRNFADAQLFASGGPLAIALPSVVVPKEFNLIINPMHTDYIQTQATIQYLGAFTAPIR